MTMVPNLSGMLGTAQKYLDRSIYNKHIPLTAADLGAGLVAAGLKVVESSYVAGVPDFSICNLNGISKDARSLPVRKVAWNLLMRASMLTRAVCDPPPTRLMSCGIMCVAVKP